MLRSIGTSFVFVLLPHRPEKCKQKGVYAPYRRLRVGREQFVVINMKNDMDTGHIRWVPSILGEVSREREAKWKTR